MGKIIPHGSIYQNRNKGMGSIVYTPNEVAKLLRIRVATVYELIKSGEIPAFQIGKNYKVPKDKFDKWFLTKTMEQTKERKKHDTA